MITEIQNSKWGIQYGRSEVWNLLYFYKDEYVKVSGGAKAKFKNPTPTFNMADPILQINNLKIVQCLNFLTAILNSKIY